MFQIVKSLGINRSCKNEKNYNDSIYMILGINNYIEGVYVADTNKFCI